MSQLILLPTQLPADQNPALVYLARLAQGSRRTQQTALAEIASQYSNGKITWDSFPWQNLRYQHVQALRSRLMDIPDFKPATINRYLSALRGVLKEAWKLGLMESDAYMRAVDIENVKSVQLPAGRMLQVAEVQALMQTCLLKDRETGVRDAAIIALLYVTGMRRSELCDLKTGDYDIQSGEVKIIAGKGNKSRTSYISGNAMRHMNNWLELRGLQPGYMFLGVNEHGNLQITPLNPQTLYDICQRRAKQAGIKSFSPHDMRRTAISEMLARGVDISTVAKIVGHEKLDTTRRYDRRDEEGKKAAARLFDVPI